MSQLTEGQIARLDVGASTRPATGESLACRIIGFSGQDVVLALDTQPQNEIVTGSEAFLLLESDGKLQAVRGQIGTPAGDEVVLRLIDDIRLGQRRVFSRAPLELPAQVSDADGSAEWATRTLDISAGGVGVAREGAADPGKGILKLKIQVANHEVLADVRVMRLTATDVGLRFEEIERQDRLLLASLALAYHRRR
jgi:PilZ domain-containing protein